MRRLLVILLLTINSLIGTSVSNSYPNSNIQISEDVSKMIEVMSTTQTAYEYLKNVHNIEQKNLPIGLPLEKEGFVRISDFYGFRKSHPVHKTRCMHRGIDFSGHRGTPILASGGGIVDKVTYSASYGKMVIIDHGNDVKSVYAHLKKTNVKKGQQVSLGEQIAELGNTGWSTGPHLHFEVRVHNKQIDPTLLLFGRNSKDEGKIISEMLNQNTLSNGTKDFKYIAGQNNRSGDQAPDKGNEKV